MYDIPSSPVFDPTPGVVAQCCSNPSCNCTCYYEPSQRVAILIHEQYHCEECNSCLTEHHLSSVVTQGLNLPNWLGPKLQEFLVAGCSSTRFPPPAEEWVVEYRRAHN